MDLNQFMLALRARRKAFVIAMAAVIVTAIAVALIVPKKYVSTATHARRCARRADHQPGTHVAARARRLHRRRRST